MKKVKKFHKNSYQQIVLITTRKFSNVLSLGTNTNTKLVRCLTVHYKHKLTKQMKTLILVVRANTTGTLFMKRLQVIIGFRRVDR